MPLAILQAADAAVDGDAQLREFLLELVDLLVTQRRDLPVFLRRQARQPGLARMHHEHLAAGRGHGFDEGAQEHVVLAVVDADAAFHRDRHPARRPHCRHGRRDPLRLGHQAGAEAAFLHPVRGTAAVEIDLVVTVFHGDGGGLRQRLGLAAAELQGQRMLARIKAQVAPGIAAQDRPGVDHLRVQPRMPRQQAQEIAAVPVGPVHHRRDGEAIGGKHGHALFSHRALVQGM